MNKDNDAKNSLRERKDTMKLENDNSFIGGDMTDLFEHDDSIYVFSDDQLVSAVSPESALITVASAQLRHNLYEPAQYHIRLMGLNRPKTTDLSKLSEALASAHPFIDAYAFKAVINNLPYTINCPTKSVFNAVKDAFRKYNGWLKIVDNDTYYRVFDEVFLSKDEFYKSMSTTAFRLNFSLRNTYNAHVRITKVPHVAATSFAVQKIMPSEFRLFDLRMFFRHLPFTIHVPNIDTAAKIAKAVTSCGGKAEVYEE
ncbi:MAG: hypothetical protein K6F27_13735 [Ruminococcus sp.]|nr:hypothetical protein [Ruminococcus sp.]